MSEYEAWMKGCEALDCRPDELEKGELPQTGLYRTQKKFVSDGREYGETPIFHVWYKGQRMYCGSMYPEALSLYRDLLKSGGVV